MAPKQKKSVSRKFVLDAAKPVADQIFDLPAFEKFLHDRIKVDGLTGNLTDSVVISKTATTITITVGANVKFAKRYLKYLTKKFCKKSGTRDFIRVIATKKDHYELRYPDIDNDGEEEEEDEE